MSEKLSSPSPASVEAQQPKDSLNYPRRILIGAMSTLVLSMALASPEVAATEASLPIAEATAADYDAEDNSENSESLADNISQTEVSYEYNLPDIANELDDIAAGSGIKASAGYEVDAGTEQQEDLTQFSESGAEEVSQEQVFATERLPSMEQPLSYGYTLVYDIEQQIAQVDRASMTERDAMVVQVVESMYAQLGINSLDEIAPGWRIAQVEVPENVSSITKGITLGEDRVIGINAYRDDIDTSTEAKEVLAHEIGHVLDVANFTDADRKEFGDLIGMSETDVWWPDGAHYDTQAGAGAFAEHFAEYLDTQNEYTNRAEVGNKVSAGELKPYFDKLIARVKS